MKQLSILTSLAVLAAATACTVKEQEEVLPVIPQYEEFYATIEQPSETMDTKTYADDQFRVLWHADDRITIFNKYTYNQQYAFLGETGDNAGGFSKVGDDDFVTGNDLSDIYAVYPYQKGTKISNDGVITVSLPAEQTWADGSFGPGSNTMISATSDNKLKFRNTGSILAFKLYGSNVQVSTITLQGNNSERIAGKATVTMPVGGTPSVAMQSDATQSITLNCATPVTIGTSAGSYTEFWFVVPPTDFAGGFTITVTCADGGTFEKSTDKSVSLARNHIYRMAPIEVIPQKPAAVPEYVDLGLSVKWATFNVGATKPEEYGEYFAWGETEPRSASSFTQYWTAYKWCNGSGVSLTKYCYGHNYGRVDNIMVLEPTDDAATVNLGSDWRTPTSTEIEELLNNCSWEYTTLNDVPGYRVTSLVSGYTDKSIFLPFPIFDNDLYKDLGCTPGTLGLYWSSSLYPQANQSSSVAYCLAFLPSDVLWDCLNRFAGFPIRPVYGEFVPVSAITLDKSSIELLIGDSAQLTTTISPSNATAPEVRCVSGDETIVSVDETGNITAVAVGTTTVTAYVSNGLSASCVVTVKEKPTINGYEYVDLGLPSGLKWASMNVGATKPEEYGDYFAWGETEPKTNYSWSTYKWYNGSYNTQTKYNTKSSYGTVDNKTALDPEDDAAHVNWGGSWRMPTDAEWTELRTKCTWTWTTQNGVNGRLVTGPNGKSIFLPAAGGQGGPDGTNLYNAGSDGLFRSSSLNYPYSAWGVCFNSGGVYRSNDYRYYGQSVRPVLSEFIPVASISLDKTSVKLNYGDLQQLAATVSPFNATAKAIHWASSDESVVYVDADGFVTGVGEGTTTVTAFGSSGVRATCTVSVSAPDLSLPASVEAVDLCLPSGLKWATMNVGARRPEAYGAWFAWGETEPKNASKWSTYKFELGTDYNGPFSKYVTNSSYGTVDNKTVLDPEDDAAHVNWGGSWRMPTDAELTELRTKCTWTWTTQNGVNGRKVTGPNGNSIFLPAAGYRRDTGLCNAGSNGNYWSSSLYTDYPYDACNVHFYSDTVRWHDRSRYYGFSVRPVTE